MELGYLGSTSVGPNAVACKCWTREYHNGRRTPKRQTQNLEGFSLRMCFAWTWIVGPVFEDLAVGIS